MTEKRKKRDRDIKKEAQIKSYLDSLPAYCTDYIKWIGNNRAAETRFAYLFDLKQFMTFLIAKKDRALSPDAYMDFQATAFSSISSGDIEEYLDSLSVMDPATLKETEISPSYRKRKLAALDMFYVYLKEKHVVDTSPVDGLDRPTPDFHYSVLSDEQVNTLLSGIRANDKFLVWKRSPDGAMHHELCDIAPEARLRRERAISRNIAIIDIMLHAGLSVSETASLNLSSIDYENRYIRYTRVDGAKISVPYTPEIRASLAEYLHAPALPIADVNLVTSMAGRDALPFCREHMLKTGIRALAKSTFQIFDDSFLDSIERIARYYRRGGRDAFSPCDGERALFLSNRGKRISVRMIEQMVRDMTLTYLPDDTKEKAFTSATLRATYIANLLKEDPQHPCLGPDQLGLHEYYVRAIKRGRAEGS